MGTLVFPPGVDAEVAGLDARNAAAGAIAARMSAAVARRGLTLLGNVNKISVQSGTVDAK
jgi:hypothetical protein